MTKKKEIKNKLGAPGLLKKNNPYLKPDGGVDLIDKFPGIDYMPYEKKKIIKRKRLRKDLFVNRLRR